MKQSQTSAAMLEDISFLDVPWKWWICDAVIVGMSKVCLLDDDS